MTMIPVEIPSGVVTKPTKAEESSNWRRAHLIRWDQGNMVPFDPWVRVPYTAPNTNVRCTYSWKDNINRTWKAFLTEDDVFVEDENGALASINPAGGAAMAPLEGTGTAGGFGDFTYSYGTYGTARPDVIDRRKYGPAFTMGNWGENLIFMTSADGRLMEWVPPDPGDPIPDAAVVANAPTGCRTFVVTPERHIIVFQDDGVPNDYAWCDKEDNTDWNFASTASEAGQLPVEPASPIVAAMRAGVTGTLFFTFKHRYLIRYIGLPYIYSHDELGEGQPPISSQSISQAGDTVEWFSETGFWRFNGVSIDSVSCDIWAWIKDNIDWAGARSTACAIHIMSSNEIWYCFPSTETGGNDRIAVHNYREGWWSQAYMGRTSGFGDDAIEGPILTNGKKFYVHREGVDYPDVDDPPYVETFTIHGEGGASFLYFHQMMPEVTGDISRLSFKLLTANKRTPGTDIETSPRKMGAHGFVDFAVAARDMRLRIAADDFSHSDWSIGAILVDMRPIGKKPGGTT